MTDVKKGQQKFNSLKPFFLSSSGSIPAPWFTLLLEINSSLFLTNQRSQKSESADPFGLNTVHIEYGFGLALSQTKVEKC